MPIYVYRCEDGHEFEQIQSITDQPCSECEVCGLSVRRVIQPAAVTFHGRGFYKTDNASQPAGAGIDL